MSKTRLAMVAVTGEHDGPWSRVRGNERGIRVLGLGEGERVTVLAEPRDPNLDTLRQDEFIAVGEYPLSFSGHSRYKVSKHANGGSGLPTTVEILLSEA